MPISLAALLAALCSVVRSRADLQLENLALRHQIIVLRRSAKKRPKLTARDRFFWVYLSRIWRDWRSTLATVRPETIVAWHRKGFRLFWTWKARHGRHGRPVVTREIRDLIRKMCRENPGWGAPRIHGELLKLGIYIGETSVSKYMLRCRKPFSQTWRTFLAGCGKSHREREKHTSGAEARTHFERLSGTSKLVPFPKPVRIGVFPQPARR